MTIWVDDWQMQCCGQPFTVGSTVSWTLRPADPEWLEAVLGADAAGEVDAAEEHHAVGTDAETTDATVESIMAVHCRYAVPTGAQTQAGYPVHGSGVLTPTDSATGWTPNTGDLRFVGYLVRLNRSTA